MGKEEEAVSAPLLQSSGFKSGRDPMENRVTNVQRVVTASANAAVVMMRGWVKDES